MANFVQSFRNAISDRFLDQRELQHLRNLNQDQQKSAPRSHDTRLGQSILSHVDKYTQSTALLLTVPIQGESVQFDFTVTPHYSEADIIPGHNRAAQLAHVSQADSLSETQSDDSRCAAASLINAYLLMGGELQSLAEKVNLKEPAMTYAFLHRAQDALYTLANSDQEDGLTNSLSYLYRGKVLLQATPKGELADAAALLGLKLQALTGPDREHKYQRSEQVKAFFAQNPQGTLIVNVYMDDAGQLLAPTETQDANHAVTVFREAEQFFVLDSGQRSNGLDDKRQALTEAEMQSLVYTSAAPVFGVRF